MSARLNILFLLSDQHSPHFTGYAGHPVVQTPHRARRDDLRRRVLDFWQPEQQLARYQACPRMPRQKHFYEFSNQFVLGNGTVVDVRP